MSESSETPNPHQPENSESKKDLVSKEEAGDFSEQKEQNENREIVEQQKELTENLLRLQDNLVQFSNDDLSIPVGEKTKQLIDEVNKQTGEGTKIAKMMAIIGASFAAVGEAANLWYGTPTTPGTTTALVGAAAGVVGLPFAAVRAGEKMIGTYKNLKQRAAANTRTGANNS